LKLLVRPDPVPGECLSSYMQRIAESNLIDPHDLWRFLNTNKHYPQSSISAPIDIYPYTLIDLNRFSELLELQVEALERLTFLSVFKKFGMDVEGCSSSRILSNEINRYRKFCPECLKTRKVYKLIWQVCDINFCPVHSVLLINRCPNCNRRIPILPSKSEIGMCPYCDTLFSDIICDDYTVQLADIKCFCDWEYILDYNEIGLQSLDTYLSEQVIAIKLIYVSSLIKNLSKEDQLKLFSIKQTARNSQISQKNVHLDSIFYFINKAGMTMREFLLFAMPHDFTVNLLMNKQKQTEKHSCIAPWCDYYKTPGSLVRKSTSVNTLKSGMKLKYYMYCSSCGTEYCLDTEGTIVERGNLIRFAWSQIRERLINHWSVQDIIKQYETTEDKVRRAAIFLAANNLIDLGLVPYKIPLSHNAEIQSTIKNLIQKGTQMKQIRKLLNMTYNDFLFYWLNSEIRVAYLGNSNPRPNKISSRDLHIGEFEHAINKLLLSNTDITIKSVCNELNITHETLRYWGFLDEVKAYKEQQKDIKDLELTKAIIDNTNKIAKALSDSNCKISSASFYKQLGIQRTVLVRRHPELTKYIHDVLQNINFN